jgi:hypothetical protein
VKFIKFFILDFRRGMHTVWRLYLCGVALFALLCLDFWNRSRIFLELYPGTSRSLGDLALYIFGGMRKFIPNPSAVFPFPTVWLLVMALACFSSLWYPLEDLYGFGKTLLTACQSRRRWYLAKAMWCGVTVSLYFALGWVVLLLGCLAMGGKFTWTISPYMMELMEITDVASTVEEWRLTLQLTLLPWLVAVTLSQLQLCLSLWMQPVLGWVVSIVVLLSSAYYASPLLLGNYAMALRDQQVLVDGVIWQGGAAYCLGLLLLCVLAGLISFQHTDILGKEGKS